MQNYFIPHYASHWKEIGVELGLAQGRLNIIKVDHHECEKQCRAMLTYWLEADADAATWNKLISVLHLLVIKSTQDQLKSG